MLSTVGERDRRFSPRRWSLATQLFAIQTAIVLLVLIGAGVAAFLNASTTNSEAAQDEVLGVARAVAAAPTVREALTSTDPSAVLQPLAEQVRRETGTDFVVVMTVNGVRLTHPDPSQIGGLFRGTIEPATRGEAITETFTGTLGPSVRAVVPVVAGGEVRGLVSVGQTVTRVSRELVAQIPLLLGTTVAALVLAGLGSWLASRWLRRTTHDLGPAELSRMYEYYDAVLHAVREGLLLLDRAGAVQLVNDEARRLLALPEDPVGRRVDDIGLPEALGAALSTGDQRSDEIFLTDDRIVVVNQAAARWDGTRLGTVVTLRDHTELRALVSELKTIRGFAESLNAQAHESANQLHTVISLIELGRPEQALRFATAELTVAQEMTDLVIGGVHEPEVAALILGKAAEAGERGVDLVIADDVELPSGVADPRDLVTIAGNLLDNAIDAAVEGSPPRWVEIGARIVNPVNGRGDADLELRVADSGPGMQPDDVPRAFQRGWSTKPHDRVLGRGLGLALVTQAVHRYGGAVVVTTDRGAVFTVSLPVPPAARGDGDPRPRAPTSEAVEPDRPAGVSSDVS
ncbi:sensor histidine kinase [Pseudonocardia sp. H11422]|uniref:sensor histidine kinase n=1 Tax=Pseudonocardia sp. H11422 TaxID=2835866 RepID=UPI002027CBFB|nr:sensor histidine kinase [Pseudonocardia sp. H11422]